MQIVFIGIVKFRIDDGVRMSEDDWDRQLNDRFESWRHSSLSM